MGATTFSNGQVFTGQGEDDFASAFTITDGVFTWVGSSSDLSESERAAPVDLGGAVVTPGFLDVHTHPVFTATLAGAAIVLPPAVGSIEELVAALGRQPNVGAEGEWVLGFGYDESGYPEGRKPNRHDLDRVSTTQPILVRRCDGHSAVCNTRALEFAGITAATPDPEGGVFERDPDGSPNGILTEPPAVDLVEAFRPVMSREALAASITNLNAHYLSEGIVGMCDLLSTLIADPLETVRLAAEQGFVPQCGLHYGWREALEAYPDGLPEGSTTGRVYIAGLKLFVDGAFSDRTAWCHQPYPGGDDTGMGLLEDADLLQAAQWARASGVQLAFHAMGDRAIQQVIDVLGPLEPWTEDVPSVRIDHATLISDEMIAQIDAAPMTFAIVSHTIFYYAEYGSYEKNLSADLAGEAYPIRRYFHSDLATALASDSPATAWSRADHVFTSVMAAVDRRSHTGGDIGQDQSITVPQALLLYTSRAADVARLSGLGRIAPGYEGSFVVLDRDPFTMAAADLDQVEVAETWVRGERLYARA